MIALPDGDLLLSTTYGRVPHLFRIDSAKTILWERVYADMLWREPFMYMHPMSNGNILCVGRDSTLRELSPNGDILRSAEENGTLAHAFQTADGGIIAYGTLADGNELYIRKRNPDWSEDWYKIYELPGDNYINQIIESIEGDLVMVGWNGTNFFEPTQGLLIRTDCQGNIVDYQVCNPPVEDYTLWPNPNGGHATLSIPPDFLDKAHAIQVFNALGQSVMEVALPQDAPTVELDAASMEQGVYFLRVWRDGEARWTTRWLIRR